MYGDSGHDTIDGGKGNDILFGDSASSTLFGDGNDTIHGGSGNDVLYGMGANDELHGGDGMDGIYGGPGNDSLFGGPGFDSLRGDDFSGSGGWDYLDGGYDGTPDQLFGGGGSDVFVVHVDAWGNSEWEVWQDFTDSEGDNSKRVKHW